MLILKATVQHNVEIIQYLGHNVAIIQYLDSVVEGVTGKHWAEPLIVAEVLLTDITKTD